MHLAIVQTSPAFGKVEENIQAAVGLMESTPADLYVLPELFNTGYNFIENLEVERVAEQADGPTFQVLLAFVQKRFCYIAYGFAVLPGRDGHPLP